MKDYKKLNLPLLTEQDEEYQMLKEVAENYTIQQIQKTAEKKSGDATEIVVRNHLLKHDFKVTLKPELSIRGPHDTVKRIDSLLLKPNVDSNKLVYYPNEVSTVIEIKNNGVAEQSNKIREKFKRLKEISASYNFAVIVLSEKLLSRTPYPYAINKEDIGINNCEVFTCVIRQKWDKMYDKAVVVEMLETGEFWKSNEWQDLINYLKGN